MATYCINNVYCMLFLQWVPMGDGCHCVASITIICLGAFPTYTVHQTQLQM